MHSHLSKLSISTCWPLSSYRPSSKRLGLKHVQTASSATSILRVHTDSNPILSRHHGARGCRVFGIAYRRSATLPGTHSLFFPRTSTYHAQFIGRVQDKLSTSVHTVLLQSLQTQANDGDEIENYLQEKVHQLSGHTVLTEDIRYLLTAYRYCFQFDTSFTFAPTVAFTGNPEFAVVATSTISSGTIVSPIFGVLVPTSCTVESPAEQLRSVIRVKGAEYLLLGPLSRVNHCCDQPNAEFIHSSDMLGYKRLVLKTLKTISVGEELTVSYGLEYFEPGACLCGSCEMNGRNGWKSGTPMDNHIRKTRGDVQIARRRDQRDMIYSYTPVNLSAIRTPGDYSRILQGSDSNRCIVEDCCMRFAGLPEGSPCSACIQRIVANPHLSTTSHRYYAATLRTARVLGPHATHRPLAAMQAFLETLHIPDWRVYQKPVVYNTKTHKQSTKATKNLPDPHLGATCEAAVSAGAVQSGQIWMMVGLWRSDNEDGVAGMRPDRTTLYCFLVLLRYQKVCNICYMMWCHSMLTGP
jgi:hypothetical protein